MYGRYIINRKSICVLLVYRPSRTGAAIGLFFEEISSLLEEVVVCSEELLIIGDFNFHMEDTADICAAQFGSLLELFNLKQHVTFPTHRSGHILDLVISRKDAEALKVNELVVMEQLISDHKAICFWLKPPNERKSVVSRRLRNFDFEAFNGMIISSGLLADVSDLSLELMVDRYDNVLRDTMDILAPVKSRTIVLRPNAPWNSNMLRHGSILGLEPREVKAVFLLRPCILILKVSKNFRETLFRGVQLIRVEVIQSRET